MTLPRSTSWPRVRLTSRTVAFAGARIATAVSCSTAGSDSSPPAARFSKRIVQGP